ncbi:hypothetical protein FCV25MIE_29190 [Fagus crenata]|uniref:Uncharacterized protein n=1 Tax=Fagus sylvatica TaxID=28930 RepID=A0A2N9ISA1_FAGSY
MSSSSGFWGSVAAAASPPRLGRSYSYASLIPRSPDLRFSGAKGIRIYHCNSSTRPDDSSASSGDSESRGVLDAFFLGKAVAEALNERIESTVGEFLSAIGRLQAEQQKQVQDFQEDVLERAKRAKEKAAREALEAQGLISKPTTAQTTPATDSVNSVTPPSVTSEITAVNPSSSSVPTTPLARPDIDPAEL